MTQRNKLQNNLLWACGALIIGLCAGYAIFDGSEPLAPQEPQEKKVAYWVAPMDANYRRDAPGKSPMGMDLIPVYEEGANDNTPSSGFTVASHIEANLGIKTTMVNREVFSTRLEAPARLTYNENNITHIQVRAEGWVEDLFVKAIGDRVSRGDKLFTLYSPDIASALADYATALKSKSSTLKKLSKGRLNSLGLSEQNINEAIKSGNWAKPIVFYAPQDGIVTQLGLREGSIATKNTIAFEVTDPSQLWLVTDIYETDADQIVLGAKAETIDQNGIKLSGKIDHIYPDLDPISHTLKARMTLENPDQSLRPGQFFMLQIHGTSESALIIPLSAVIRQGSGNHVILALGDGQYQAAKVMLGKTIGDKVQIHSGLMEGERVVISGQFLLDSESSFTGASVRLLEGQDD